MRYQSSQIILTASLLFIISACSSDSNIQSNDTSPVMQIDAPVMQTVKLPINHTQWTKWVCRDSSNIFTKFSDSSYRVLDVKYNDGQYALARQANSQLAIFQDEHLAFFSDGNTAILGQPDSSIIFTSGCNVVE